MDIMVGFVVGVMVVAPVGPISLLLITIGLERGAGAGVRAGLGVAAADAALLLVVLAAADRLTALDPTWQRGIEVALGLGLVLIGIRAVAARAGITKAVERIQRPGRVLMIATLANPMTVLAWLGLMVALGSELGQGWALVRTGIGIVLASLAWHVALGAASGSVGERLSPARRLLVQRASGVAMVGLGVLLAV